MTYEEFSSRNISDGFQVLFVYANDVTSGIFSNMLLFALFIIVLLGSFFASKRQTGSGNLAISFAVAGYFITGASLIMSFVDGLVNVYTIIICIGIAVIGTLWLLIEGSGN